ncbi:MAG: right-handed parallel beta-helix repeat-containing protein, partial [Planctomycetes bacterium]|nr:right-handed parallel beta-helix repeat-containing protein [Planctomycetota bacterium]
MVNVFHYGAAGDGAADDTAALEHALAAGDGVLELNKGTYRITRPLVLDTTRLGYVAVRGIGGASRIVMAGAGPALRIVGDHRGTAQPQSVEAHTWERERFPTVTGVEILGDHAQAVGIELRRTMQPTITEVLVRRCRIGVHLVERNRNVLISTSHIYDNAEYGIFFDRCNLHQTIVCGNHISYNKLAGIKSLDGDVHNLHITGNDIEYNNKPGDLPQPPLRKGGRGGVAPPLDKGGQGGVGGEPTGAEIWFEATEGIISEVTIASNTIQATAEPGGANVRIRGSEADSPRGARLIAITGNVLGSQMRGIELRHAHRVTITGNTIYGADDLSLAVARSSGVIIGANTIAWHNRDEDPPRDGILFEGCNNCSISGVVAHQMAAGTDDRGAAVALVRS